MVIHNNKVKARPLRFIDWHNIPAVAQQLLMLLTLPAAADCGLSLCLHPPQTPMSTVASATHSAAQP
jgi:hypothetical protein